MSHSAPTLDFFYRTPLGQYVLEWEQAQYDKLVTDCFGYNALQLGAAGTNFLRANRIPLKILADEDLKIVTAARGEEDCHPMLLSFEELPFESESFDLVVLPHTVEGVEDPHKLLREVERVLIPNGRVVITGFNLVSLWGLRFKLQRLGARPFLPGRQFLSIFRLRDWLELLNMTLDRGAFGCYESVWSASRNKRSPWLEKSGDRWWPQCGALFAISATKNAPGFKMVGKAINRKKTILGRQTAHVRKEPG